MSSECDGQGYLDIGRGKGVSSSLQRDVGAGLTNAPAATPAESRELGPLREGGGRASSSAAPPGDLPPAAAPRGPPHPAAPQALPALADRGRRGAAARRAAPRAEEPGERPLWMRPPSWLYLPHLGCGGGTDVGSASEHRDGAEPHDAQDGARHPSDGLQQARRDDGGSIRGRVQSPGAWRPRSADAAGSIRGRTAAPGYSGARGLGAAALARHFADLDQERAAKRARLRDQAQGRDELTAAQRIAAIRLRVAARTGGTSTRGALGIDSAATAPSSSTEDVKMHLNLIGKDDGGGYMEAAGRPSPAAAADAARQAWHAAGARPTAA